MNITFVGAFKNNKNIFCRLVALLLVASLLIVVPGCKEKEPEIISGNDIPPLPTKPAAEAPTNSNNEIVIRGVFTHIDIENMRMMFVDMKQYVEYEVPYHGGTDIKTKYDTVIPANSMDIGGVYEVVCDARGNAKTVYGVKDSWEKNSITGFEINEASKTIEYGSASVKYNGNTIVLSNGERVALSTLVAQDEITLRGEGDTIYSITVDKGHGFLKLTGVDAFVNGYVTVGTKQLLAITENMIITASEGSHKIELQNGSIRAQKSVTIKEGEQAVLDFSEYIKPAVQNGVVKFMVNIDNAIMVLDGVEKSYEGLHTLSYGNHTAIFKANGYQQYTLKFTVDSAYETHIIDMVASGSSTTKASSDKTDGYYVKVTAPEGASLYVDSVYKGTVPCQFDKTAGNRIITLAKDGYETISYTISITNTTGDVTYAFPEMTKSQ